MEDEILQSHQRILPLLSLLRIFLQLVWQICDVWSHRRFPHLSCQRCSAQSCSDQTCQCLVDYRRQLQCWTNGSLTRRWKQREQEPDKEAWKRKGSLMSSKQPKHLILMSVRSAGTTFPIHQIQKDSRNTGLLAGAGSTPHECAKNINHFAR